MELKMFSGYLRNIKDLCLQLNIPFTANRTDLEKEAILKAWDKWGTDTGSHLFGAFSFAVFDEKTNTLYCVRDQLGMEQLYYYVTSTGNFLYSPDIKTIKSHPEFVRSIDVEALQTYIMFGYSAGEKTLYKGIKKLPAGCCLISKGSSVSIHSYYTVRFSPRYDISEDSFCDMIEETAVKLIAEDNSQNDTASSASFLSGGVDSSWLLSLCGAEKAVGVGYESSYTDETGYAAETAKRLGRAFQKKTVTPAEYFDSLPALFQGLELPLADASSPAFSLGCRAVSKNNRFCYSGEGPDEFFAGYSLYLRADELAHDGGPLHFGCFGLMEEETARVLLGYDKSLFDGNHLVSGIYETTSESEHLARILAIDIHLFFEGDILFNLTRNAKANGLEIRAPFSDPRMLQLSTMIPSNLKLKDGQGKYIFRKTAARSIPYETAFREKTAFAVPIKKWMYIDTIQKRIESVLFSKSSEIFFSQKLLRKWWEEFLSGRQSLWNIIYGLYAFLIWYEDCFK